MKTVGFVKEDNQRDTIPLLLGCLATLGLCVYSAVHLNVPPKDKRRCRTLGREMVWCLVGLFAPEFLLYIAWSQLVSAQVLESETNKIVDESTRRIPTEKQTCDLISNHQVHTSDTRQKPSTLDYTKRELTR